MVSHRGVDRERREALVSGRGRVHAVSFSASISGRFSITVMEEDGNWASVEGGGITLMETDELEAILSGSQPMLRQEALVGELPTPIPIVVQHG